MSRAGIERARHSLRSEMSSSFGKIRTPWPNAPAPTHYEVNNLVMQHWSTDNVWSGRWVLHWRTVTMLCAPCRRREVSLWLPNEFRLE
jgi:hypothetical protein